MKKLSLTLLVGLSILLSCDKEEAVPELSMNEQVLQELTANGYEGIITDEGVLIFKGFKNISEASNYMNRVLVKLEFSYAKLILDQGNTSARTENLECTQSEIYHVNGLACANFLCVSDAPMLDYDCFDGECYGMSTTCV